VRNGWAYWNARDSRPLHTWRSRSDREQAVSLAAREVCAEQAATTALAEGDWIAAAELEEERVVRQHELALLLLEQRVESADQNADE
jgi:hypothetical protein